MAHSLGTCDPFLSRDHLQVDDGGLVMSVNPGFGGQSFIPSSFAKVRQIKTLVGKRPVEIPVNGCVRGRRPAPAQAVKDLRSAPEVLK